MGLAHGNQIFTPYHIGWIRAVSKRACVDDLCCDQRFLPKQPFLPWKSEGFWPENSAKSSRPIYTIKCISKNQIKIVFSRTGSE